MAIGGTTVAPQADNNRAEAMRMRILLVIEMIINHWNTCVKMVYDR